MQEINALTREIDYLSNISRDVIHLWFSQTYKQHEAGKNKLTANGLSVNGVRPSKVAASKVTVDLVDEETVYSSDNEWEHFSGSESQYSSDSESQPTVGPIAKPDAQKPAKSIKLKKRIKITFNKKQKKQPCMDPNHSHNHKAKSEDRYCLPVDTSLKNSNEFGFEYFYGQIGTTFEYYNRHEEELLDQTFFNLDEERNDRLADLIESNISLTNTNEGGSHEQSLLHLQDSNEKDSNDSFFVNDSLSVNDSYFDPDNSFHANATSQSRGMQANTSKLVAVEEIYGKEGDEPIYEDNLLLKNSNNNAVKKSEILEDESLASGQSLSVSYRSDEQSYEHELEVAKQIEKLNAELLRDLADYSAAKTIQIENSSVENHEKSDKAGKKLEKTTKQLEEAHKKLQRIQDERLQLVELGNQKTDSRDDLEVEQNNKNEIIMNENGEYNYNSPGDNRFYRSVYDPSTEDRHILANTEETNELISEENHEISANNSAKSFKRKVSSDSEEDDGKALGEHSGEEEQNNTTWTEVYSVKGDSNEYKEEEKEEILPIIQELTLEEKGRIAASNAAKFRECKKNSDAKLAAANVDVEELENALDNAKAAHGKAAYEHLADEQNTEKKEVFEAAENELEVVNTALEEAIENQERVAALAAENDRLSEKANAERNRINRE